MRIEDFNLERGQGTGRVSARIIWEDCAREDEEVYFEVRDEAVVDSLTINPNAFLVGRAISAMHYGEERVYVDGEICPQLEKGVHTAMSVIRGWPNGRNYRLPQIEAKNRTRFPRPASGRRAACFFSGGVDSFATLRTNHDSYPDGHPNRIVDGLLVYGLEMDSEEAFDHVLAQLRLVAEATEINLIPIYTNVYLNFREEDRNNGFDFWIYEFQGAALASTAHFLASRVNSISIAATYDLPHLGPWGSHPLLDDHYSSFDLRVRHDGLIVSRLEKVRSISGWPEALQNLRVCNRYQAYDDEKVNCGECEKCVRTKLELFVLGILEEAPVFRESSLSPDLILAGIKIHDDYVLSCYVQLLDPLSELGRKDLVSAIKNRISEYYSGQESSWTGKVRAWDRRYLRGMARTAWQAVQPLIKKNP